MTALEGQARLLLNDLREYGAWLAYDQRRPVAEREAAERWLREVLEPSLERLVPEIGSARDALQAYCDVLEQKWLRSEQAGRDIGLGAAIETYLAAGAPAPETGAGPSGSINPEIDWAAGLDVRGSDGDQDDLDPVDNPTSAAR